MDILEKINRTFGNWYEGLFGGSDDVRPKDILRRILAAMEDHRKEGFDNKIYVPNQYILEIAVDDEEERDYLLSFLDRAELETAIRRYCQQNHYHIRGGLDFTIKENEDPEAAKRGEKVRVRCRYNTKVTGPEPAPPAVASAPEPIAALPSVPVEERTVASARAFEGSEETGTVPAVALATLVVYAPDRPPFRYLMARGAVTIGRSTRADNDLVIESDGQISKRHARLELDSDGAFTLYDLDSTNGTKVNGRRIDNRTLHNGDEITVGSTRILFQQQGAEENVSEEMSPRRSQGTFGGAAASHREEGGSSSPPVRPLRVRAARLILTDGDQDVDDYLLASETLLGRGVTNDIVLPDRSLATRHARIVNDGAGYLLENLSDEAGNTTRNGLPIEPGQTAPLRDGDLVGLGRLTLRFEDGTGK
jgi:pSer/pThr/pTyr-binding forkhead associated (FHA) protein